MTNQEIVRTFYKRVVSENRLDELERYVSETCIQRTGETEVSIGTEGMREHLLALRKTYPDYTVRILCQYVDGDYVISEVVMAGTHKGEFAGIKPTNQRLEITGVNIDKVVDGKIAVHGGAANTFETFWEHGLIVPG